MSTITISRRHQGPFGSANGGFVAGLLGEVIGPFPSRVVLRKPIALDTPLRLASFEDRVELEHEGILVASAERDETGIPPARFVTSEEILDTPASQIDMGMFAACFVCGQDPPDGLGIRPRRLPDGRFAAIWKPSTSNHVRGARVPARYLRSALDCPGGFAALTASQTLAVTGSLTSRVDWLPSAQDSLIVVGEATWVDGRKLGASSTIFSQSGKVVATASAVWVAVEPTTSLEPPATRRTEPVPLS